MGGKYKSRLLSAAKTSFKSKGYRKTFSSKKRLKEL